jgi:hypothetical protein
MYYKAFSYATARFMRLIMLKARKQSKQSVTIAVFGEKRGGQMAVRRRREDLSDVMHDVPCKLSCSNSEGLS